MWKEIEKCKFILGAPIRTDFAELEEGDIIQLSNTSSTKSFHFSWFNWANEPTDSWKYTLSKGKSFYLQEPVCGIVTDKIVKIHQDTIFEGANSPEVLEYLSHYYVIGVTVAQDVQLQINSSALLNELVIHKWE